jgi:hypothetical protein
VIIVSDPLYPLYDPSHVIPLPDGGHTYDAFTETVGGVFDWNLTTGLLTNGVGFASGGPFFQDMTTGVGIFRGNFLNFSNAAGDILQLNSGNHGGAIPGPTGALGTFATDLWVSCAQCVPSANEQFVGGKATVTAFADPVSTPEPGSTLLLCVGMLMTAAFVLLLRQNALSSSSN